MRIKILLATVAIAVTPMLAFAAELPPASNFDAGKLLRAADLKSLLQVVSDLNMSPSTGKSFPDLYDASTYIGVKNSSPQRVLDVLGWPTPSPANSVRMRGYQASFEVMNNAGTANWYFGVDDSDMNKLKIGGGYSAGQAGGVPVLTVLGLGGQVSIGSANPGDGVFSVTSNSIYANNDHIAAFTRDGGSEELMRMYHFGVNPRPIFSFVSARGSAAAPQAVQLGNSIGILDFRGFDSAIESDTSAQISAIATQDWTKTQHGSALRFFTTTNGSINPAERMTIDQDGSVTMQRLCIGHTCITEAQLKKLLGQ